MLDGEIPIQRLNGTCDLAAMEDVVSCGRCPFAPFAFDLLHLGGTDLRERPLIERKAMLLDLMAPAGKGSSFPIR